MNVNKIEANILIENIDDYKVIKQYLKENRIKILGEYFNSNNKKTPGLNLFCSINIYITLDEYQELAFLSDNPLSNISIQLVNSAGVGMSDNSMKVIGSLPYMKNILSNHVPEDPDGQSGKFATQEYYRKQVTNIDKFMGATHLFMLNAFKSSSNIVNDYIKSEMMSYQDKLDDLNIMVRFFEGNPDKNKKLFHTQRYEDCTFLLNIISKLNKYYETGE
jgi:hypothetical protein